MVEIFGKRILEEMKKQKSSEVGDSDAGTQAAKMDEGVTSS
jgi:hypothetical protein